MSKAAAGSPPLSGIEDSGKYPVHYRFSHAKKGNQHLVVVFANFSAPDEYGWSNGVFDSLRSNILWIRDLFDGKNSYYLCKGMDFELERSVVTLISNVMNSLGLTPDQCTMWGGSKGGSAALYFGLKYGFRNIVSIVPQFRIGTYLHTQPTVAEFMMGQVTEENVRILDNVIPDLVRAGANRGANIYVLSSPQDEQYPVQVEPFLGLFNGYENFNFIFSDSPYITDHTEVTRRNVPALMGLINFLIDGMAPRLGFVVNGNEQPDADRSAIEGYLKATSQVRTAFAAPEVHAPVSGESVHPSAVRFTGSAAGAVRVSLWENGKFLSSPQVGPDGRWSWDPDRAWSVGKHVVRLFAVAPAGYHSPRTEIVFAVSDLGTRQVLAQPTAPLTQLTAPVVSVPAPGQQVSGPVVTLMGYAAGAAHVEFVEDGMRLGMAPVAPDTGWAWDPGWSWTEGSHTVECHAVDRSGNASQRTVVTFGVVNAYVS
ncbi:hypothetical protein [Streptomyces sp. ITFR-16]|uniref:hypothetical protein n=1 Tax=Streptomyces sp. ITFR-16 TaxID=3075198 RepID=UPI0028897223|nr:hypothetical protein [Streptomyces sp. ITFR-16]WNI21755.1 hypothetical protein RLT58_07335 [Streptomyces sp. ITFR-16]